MALELRQIEDLHRADDEEPVQTVALAQEGKFLKFPDARLTVANLVQGPETRQQMEVIGKGWISELTDGGSVIVIGVVRECSDGRRRIVPNTVRRAGSDGSTNHYIEGISKCALCEYDVPHTH
jgi:hypothetical protein